jgi:hypothetical protein
MSAFPLGQIVATPGALAALKRGKQSIACFLDRHAIGDWVNWIKAMSQRTSSVWSAGFDC